MASNLKSIPATAFYTAMPQLVSRVTHNQEETAMIVQEILKRVLNKFPTQAMWPLAWLKGSRNSVRATIGEQIFAGAETNYPEGHRMKKLLRASSGLFEYFMRVAT